jgi:HAD superfamily hydrolase (TIGR01509 family)
MKVILFDFDGTIVNSLSTILTVTNRLSTEFGYPPIDAETFRKLQNLSSRQVFQELDISIFKLPFLARRFNREYAREVPTLPFIPGMKETLLDLKKQGHWLGIVSTNSSKNIQAFLKYQGIYEQFDVVSCSLSLFGKNRLIQRILRQHQFLPENAIYIGDETRDIEAARRSGVTAIAVTWGFNSEAVLNSHQPDFLLKHPSQILQVLSLQS